MLAKRVPGGARSEEDLDHAVRRIISRAVAPEGEKVSGVVLADQVKSLDWERRNANLITKLPTKIVTEVLAKLGTLLL